MLGGPPPVDGAGSLSDVVHPRTNQETVHKPINAFIVRIVLTVAISRAAVDSRAMGAHGVSFGPVGAIAGRDAVPTPFGELHQNPD